MGRGVFTEFESVWESLKLCKFTYLPTCVPFFALLEFVQ